MKLLDTPSYLPNSLSPPLGDLRCDPIRVVAFKKIHISYTQLTAPLFVAYLMYQATPKCIWIAIFFFSFSSTLIRIFIGYTHTMDPLSEASVDAYILLFHHHWKEKRYVLTSHTRHVGWYISPRIRIGSIVLLHGWWHALQHVCCCWVDSTSSSIIMILTMVYRCFCCWCCCHLWMC